MQHVTRLDSPLKRYLFAVGTVLVGDAFRAALNPWLGEAAPLLLLTLPVVLSAFYAGFGPSLLATALAAITGTYLFVNGPGFDGLDTTQWLRIAIFLSIGVAVSVLGKRRMDAFQASVDAAQRLQLANRRKDEFLAMLAHELRNPLASINTAAALVQAAGTDDGQARHAAHVISRQVEHMTRLVDDLLDVARVTRGLVHLQQRPVDLAHIAAQTLEQMAPVMAARGHDLHVELPSTPALVFGDEVRLAQAMGNLLNNAAKYTLPGGDIRLRVQTAGDTVEVQVQDNGAGISPELLPHVFDLFVQAERTIDRSQGGLGIGLALVRTVIELHGGSVHVHSAGAGSGSRFTLRLPRLDSEAEPAPTPSAAHDPAPVAQPAPAADAAPDASLRVLVVDDNVDAAQTLALFIEALGHATMVDFDSASALERVQHECYDVFVLDIGLPGMDGFALCEALHRSPNGAEALYIAATGYGSETDRAQSRQAGFHHHLVKPLDLHALSSLLSRRAVERAPGPTATP